MKRKYGGLITGLVFIGAGIGYIGNFVGWWSGFTIFFPGWWSLFIIMPFIIAIAESGFNTGNTIGLLVGLFFLVSAWVKINFKMIFPIILIAIGLLIILKSKKVKLRRIKTVDGGAFYIPVYRCWLNNRNVKFGNFELHGAEITTLFGTLELDLSEAIFTKDVVIDVTNIFTGAKIILPPNVKVETSVNRLFGKVINRTSSDPAAVHTVFINANCLFHDTEVRTADYK